MEKGDGSFSMLSDDIIFHQILTWFDYRWTLNTARLVCKYWNENYKCIKPCQFLIRYSRNVPHLKFILTNHSDELYKVTDLVFQNPSDSCCEIEKHFISKMTGLRTLDLRNSCVDLIVEFTKLETLQNLNLNSLDSKSVSILFKRKSNITSLSILSLRSNDVDLNFDELDWPLERLSLYYSSLSLKSNMTIFNSKFANNLKALTIVTSTVFENSLLQYLCNLKSITEFTLLARNALTLEDMKFFSAIVNLKKLVFRSLVIGDEGIMYLSNLTKLEEFSLPDNLVTASAFPNFENIKKLDLKRNKIGNEGAVNLCLLSKLSHLDLSDNLISDEGLKYFCKLTKVRDLNLARNQIGDVGANYLSQNYNLEILDLSSNLIGSEGLRQFKNLKLLHHLILNNNNIGNGLQYLCYCDRLKILKISSNNIGDGAVIDLLSCEFPNMYNLDLSNNIITKNSCEIISKNTSLSKLNVSHNSNIGGGVALLGKLDILIAENCSITDSGLIGYLKSLPKHHHISLHIKSNMFTNKALRALIDFASDGTIDELSLSHSSKFDPNLKKQLSTLPIERFNCLEYLEPGKTEQKRMCFVQ